MQERSTRFVLRILAFHGVLLVVVLGVVSVASVEIFRSTRDDALFQAKSRQQLLASQTCRGIESFYSAIIKDLGWLQSPPEQGGAVGRAGAGGASPATQPGNFQMERLEGGRNPVAVQLIADQLGDRVSALFVYNKQTDELAPFLPAGSKLQAGDLPTEIRSWLKSVDQTEVSHLMKLDGKGVSLVAAPFSTTPYRRLSQTAGRRGGSAIGRGQAALQGPIIHPAPRLLVAAVPGEDIETNFLPLLSDEEGASATLVDSRLQVITTSNHVLEGMNLADFDNPGVNDMIVAYKSHPIIQTEIFNDPLSRYTTKIGPRMVTLAPVDVGQGQGQWTLFLAYPLESIDQAVDVLFKRAVFWATFVSISITAILASTALQMVRWRVRLERERHQVLTEELIKARRIQEQWLPDLASAPAGIDIAAVNLPASHISGDLYNWFELADGRQALVIGDVTGHGMAAAFLMATTQLLVRNTMTRIPTAGAAMEDVNNQLGAQVFHGQFVTMLIVTLDFARKTLEVASAGHPPPLVGRDGGVSPLLVEAQLVLGVEKHIAYPTLQVAMGDMNNLLLYTDGVLDARNPNGERFGKDRLAASLKGRQGSAAEMVAGVSKAVEDFRGGEEPDDDVTLVAIHFHRPAPGIAAAGSVRRALPAVGPAVTVVT